ncbi:MAG TPA: DUF4403 family protein [Chitinophagaceae bacterium]|jgi:hypothetical protein|nr:DUF4403 family protein [Chitinophagaceae bacterium]
MRFFLLFGCLIILFSGCSRKRVPQPAVTAPPVAVPAPADTLPLSVISIPISINLQPFFALAEQSVDTVFTSPGWPEGWVEADCATRYKYRFRRSPLRIAAEGTVARLSFTGFYRIIGSTRACAGSTVLSPWTPPCRCGFEEGERKVTIGFTAGFQLRPDHLLLADFRRAEPVAENKCTVCFWGQDITGTVLNGLKAELDLSRKALADSFGRTDLRPYFQAAWNKLAEPIALPGLGFVRLNPQALHLEGLSARGSQLQLQAGISARPLVAPVAGTAPAGAVPRLTPAPAKGSFSLYLDAALSYDSLSGLLTTYLKGKRFEVTEGPVKKHVVVEAVSLQGEGSGLRLGLTFSGSHRGTVYLTGRPEYDAPTETLEIRDLDYDLRTRDLLVKSARWLFNKRILAELNGYTKFPMTEYYQTAAQTLQGWLNREWARGIRSTGSIASLKLVRIRARPDHLSLRSHCGGRMAVAVTGN